MDQHSCQEETDGDLHLLHGIFNRLLSFLYTVTAAVSSLTFVTPHVSLPKSSASFTSSVIMKLSKIVPDFT